MFNRQRLEKLSLGLGAVSEYSGRIVSWLVLLLVLVICYEVLIMKGLFNGSPALQELQWHIFGLIFLLGSAYTLRHEGHVRIEIFYQNMDRRRRAWVDLLGTVFFLLPFCITLFLVSIPFAVAAFVSGEGTPDAGGLPYRFLIKSAIPLGFLLLTMEGIAFLIKNLLILTARE